MEISLHKMTNEDVDDILHISKLSFPISWSRKSIESELSNKLAHYSIAKIKDKIVGFGGMWTIVDESQITNIAVHPHYRGNGIASLILNELINVCENKKVTGLTLEVRKSNNIAQNLYKKFGFIHEGIRPKYYEDNGEDAFLMWKRWQK